MPHDWNNTLVVTYDEILPWYKTEDNVRQALNRHKNKNYGIKSIRRGCKGHPALISFDSLPNEIQQGLGDPRKCDHKLERFYKSDGEAVRYFAKFRFEDKTALTAVHQEAYVINASVIKAVLALREARIRERKTKGGSLRGINSTLCADAISFQATLLTKHDVRHSLPENERVFISTLKKFEDQGYPSLISGKHKNQNSRKVTDDTLALLISLFAGRSEKPTTAEVYREYAAFIDGYIEVINNATGEVYEPANFKKLSDTTVKNYMMQWSNKIGTYQARSKDRLNLMRQFKPYHSLLRPKFAGSVISIDDRQPPFKALNGKRVWFYMGIDLASEAFTCWVYGDTKEGIITEFYRQMVRNYVMWGFNIPAELEAELSLNSSFKESLLKEGNMFQHVNILPNNPRRKRIERYFKSLRYGAEKERTGWLARPHALSEANQPAIEIEKVPMVPYEDIIEGSLTDIEDWNNQPHSIHTHLSRWEVFCQMQNPDIKPTNYEGILPYIGYRTQTSCNVGIIRLNYGEFLLGNEGKISLGQNLINLLKQIEGKEVDVYWIDDNEGRVLKALVYLGTLFICEALVKPAYQRSKVEKTAQDEANAKIMCAYVASIESFAKRRKNAIEKVTVISNRPEQPKTFTMPGVRRYEPTKERAAEVLPPPPDEEDDLAYIRSLSFSVDLKDRF